MVNIRSESSEEKYFYFHISDYLGLRLDKNSQAKMKDIISKRNLQEKITTYKHCKYEIENDICDSNGNCKEFSIKNAWIEYINRLYGTINGLVILISVEEKMITKNQWKH